jgi:hypothetical protein
MTTRTLAKLWLAGLRAEWGKRRADCPPDVQTAGDAFLAALGAWVTS